MFKCRLSVLHWITTIAGFIIIHSSQQASQAYTSHINPKMPCSNSMEDEENRRFRGETVDRSRWNFWSSAENLFPTPRSNTTTRCPEYVGRNLRIGAREQIVAASAKRFSPFFVDNAPPRIKIYLIHRLALTANETLIPWLNGADINLGHGADLARWLIISTSWLRKH